MRSVRTHACKEWLPRVPHVAAPARDSTKYINGRHVRDLSMLNRDLNKVLLVTTDAHAAALQPDNAVKVRTVHDHL